MIDVVKHVTTEELESGLDEILRSPKDAGALEFIVRRPRVSEREVLTEGELHPSEGLVGDCWRTRGSSRTLDGSAHPDMQLNVMNSRVIALVAQGRERWPLAGDQLYIDLDLSGENLPAGTRLALGEALIEVTAQPHTGGRKSGEGFGIGARKFVNPGVGRERNRRGINARVVRRGVIRVGDVAKKI